MPVYDKADILSAGVFINRYGMANTNVNFRTGPGTKNSAIRKVEEGEYVYLIINETGTDGELWTRVNADGTEGYIKSEYIDLLSEEESQAHDAVQPSPAPYYTPEPVWEPTAEPIPEPTEEPTPEPMYEPTAEPTAEPAPEPTAEPTA